MSKDKEPKDFRNDNRLIYLTGVFNESKAEQIVMRLLEFESQDPKKDIILYIDSYGGIIDSFISIHDTIRLLRCDVATVCIGKAMSCGQLLLMSGTKGKRFITPNSRILIHEVISGTFGKLADLQNDIEESHRLQKILNDMIIKYTKISKKQLDDILSKDSYFNAKDALRLGIVDHIITDSSVLYKRVNI